MSQTCFVKLVLFQEWSRDDHQIYPGGPSQISRWPVCLQMVHFFVHHSVKFFILYKKVLRCLYLKMLSLNGVSILISSNLVSGRQGEHKHKSALIKIKVSFQLVIFLLLYFHSSRNSETKFDVIIESRIPSLFRFFNLLSYIIFLADLIRWSYIPFLLPTILTLFPTPEILSCPRSFFVWNLLVWNIIFIRGSASSCCE